MPHDEMRKNPALLYRHSHLRWVIGANTCSRGSQWVLLVPSPRCESRSMVALRYE